MSVFSSIAERFDVLNEETLLESTVRNEERINPQQKRGFGQNKTVVDVRELLKCYNSLRIIEFNRVSNVMMFWPMSDGTMQI